MGERTWPLPRSDRRHKAHKQLTMLRAALAAHQAEITTKQKLKEKLQAA